MGLATEHEGAQVLGKSSVCPRSPTAGTGQCSEDTAPLLGSGMRITQKLPLTWGFTWSLGTLKKQVLEGRLWRMEFFQLPQPSLKKRKRCLDPGNDMGQL